MRQVKRTVIAFSWLFHRSWAESILMVFNIVTATVFVSFFLSVGINLYNNMVKEYSVTWDFEQLVIFVTKEFTTEEEKYLTDDIKQIRKFYDTEAINMGREDSIGIIEISDSFFFEKTDKEGFLAYDEKKELNGVVISENYRKKIGMKLEEVGKREINISINNEEMTFLIVAVLNPDVDDVLTNYYNRDIYIPKEMLGGSDNLSLQIISIQVKNSAHYKEKIKKFNCYVVDENADKNHYIYLARIISGIVIFFGILFGFLAALGVIDANRKFLNKNLNRIYLMMTMGFPIALVKRIFYYMGSLMGIISSVIGLFVLKGIFIFFTTRYQDQKIYNISLTDLMCFDYYIIILSCFVVEIIIFIYMYVSMHKMTNDTIIYGLAEME